MSDEAVTGANMTEITLDAGPEADEPSGAPKKINHQYVQKTLRGITHSLTIFDDFYLSYDFQVANPKAFKLNFFKSKDFKQSHINLTYLDPEPVRKTHIAWNWLITAMAVLTVAIVLIYIGEFSRASFRHEAMLPAGVLLGTFGLISLFVFFFKTQDRVMYRSYIGRVPIFELFHCPRKDDYNKFIDILEKTIYAAQKRPSVDMKYRLVGELKHVRKMADSKLIPEKVYEAARTKIFKHKAYQV